MAWNEPGNSGDNDKDPWGKKRNEQGPPDLEDIIKNLQNKVTGIFGGRGGGGGGGRSSDSGIAGVVGIVITLLLIWFTYSSVYILNPRENGVVLRFGQFVDTIQPGFSFRPWPIETVEIVDVGITRSYHIGQGSTEALILTNDENIVDMELEVQYQVLEAKKFVLNTREPEESLKQATHTAVRELVGQNTMVYLMTTGRADFAIKAQDRTQEILDRYDTGLSIISFNLQPVQAPPAVKPAFDDVTAAAQDKNDAINQAINRANEIIPKAEGEANKLREQAQQYKETLIAKANGDAERFSRLLAQYEKAPRVTRERLYLETMQDIMARSKKVILDVDKGNSLMYLPIDQIVSGQRKQGNAATNMDESKQSFGNSQESTTIPSPNDLRSRTRETR